MALSKNIGINYFAVLILWFFGPALASGLELEVGVARLRERNLSDANQILASRIATRFVDTVKACDERQVDILEWEKLTDAVAERQIWEAQKEIAALEARKDQLLFQPQSTSSARRSLETQIAAKRRGLEELKEQLFLNPGERSASVGLLLTQANQEQKLLPPPAIINGLPGKAANPDLLIYGVLEEIQDFLYLELHLYSFPEKEDLAFFKKATAVDSVNPMIEEALGYFVEALIGRPWCALSVSAAPQEEAVIYLDRRLIGLGGFHDPFLRPGTYTLEVEAPGYRPYSEVIRARAYQKYSVVVELSEEEKTPVTIDSLPSGAEVYLNALWLGKTPLTVELGESVSQLRLSRKGYNDYLTLISRPDQSRLLFNLTPGNSPKPDYIQRKRDQFYIMLSFFILSVPLAPVFYDLSATSRVKHSQELAANGLSSAANRFSQEGDLYYSLYFFGLFSSVILLAASTDYFFDYVDAVEWSNN